MSAKGRINHIINALTQSGFYTENEPTRPGEFTPAFASSLRSFLEYKGDENEKEHKKAKRIQRVLNAFRTVESQIFRGIPRNHSTIDKNVQTSIEIYIAQMEASLLQIEKEIA